MSQNLFQQLADASNRAQVNAAMDSASRQFMIGRQRPERLSLGGPLRFVIFMSIMAIAGFIAVVNAKTNSGLAMLVLFFGFVGSIIATRMVHVAAQWERGVVLRLGTLQSVRGPGLVVIFPVIDYLKLVDTRTQTLEIPQQRVITRDNVPVSINGVLYVKVSDVGLAVTKIQDFEFGILQYAQAALRDVIGRLTLDELLAERDQVQHEIEQAIEKASSGWGLDVEALRLQDIDMPEELKKMMSRQASAEREKRATITKAEGDKLAAINLAEAANTMMASPGAMQLRTLQTIDGLGPQASNTVVIPLPTDLFTVLHSISKTKGAVVVEGAPAPAGNPGT